MGTTFKSDIAIDDIIVADGYCRTPGKHNTYLYSPERRNSNILICCRK